MKLLSENQKAHLLTCAMNAEICDYSRKYMNVFIEYLNLVSKDTKDSMLEFLRTTSPMTARMYFEIFRQKPRLFTYLKNKMFKIINTITFIIFGILFAQIFLEWFLGGIK